MLSTMLLSEYSDLGEDIVIAVAKIVDNDDIVPNLEKLKRGMRSNETKSTRDEDEAFIGRHGRYIVSH